MSELRKKFNGKDNGHGTMPNQSTLPVPINPPNNVAHVDLNLARIPLVHIRGAKNGPWEFKLDGQVVKGTRRLTKKEVAIYSELCRLYEDAGMPESGEFFRSQYGLIRHLTPKDRHPRDSGGHNKKFLKKCIENISETFIHFKDCYQENGARVNELVSFSLLERAKLYDHEKDPQFFLSEFMFPRWIVKNMRAGWWKPVSIAILSHFKSEKALAAWILVDRVLGGDQESYNKDLREFCYECGIVFERERDYYPKMRAVLRHLRNAPLTNGQKINIAHLSKSQTPSGWKVVVARGQKALPSIKHRTPNGRPKTKAEIEAENRIREERILLEWYEQQPGEARHEIDERVKSIAKELHGPFWDKPLSLEIAKLESIRRAYSHDLTCNRLIEHANKNGATLREAPSGLSYGIGLEAVNKRLMALCRCRCAGAKSSLPGAGEAPIPQPVLSEAVP